MIDFGECVYCKTIGGLLLFNECLMLVPNSNEHSVTNDKTHLLHVEEQSRIEKRYVSQGMQVFVSGVLNPDCARWTMLPP